MAGAGARGGSGGKAELQFAGDDDNRRALGAGDTIAPSARPPSPEPAASLLSKALMRWLGPLFAKGIVAPLTLDDLWGLSPGDDAPSVARDFQEHYDREGSATGALKAQFKRLFVHLGVLRLFSDCTGFVVPFLLSMLLQHLEEVGDGVPAEDRLWGEWGGYLVALTLTGMQMVRTVVQQRFYYLCIRLGMRVRVAVTTAVFRKSLRLSPAARAGSTTGEILTLMNSDALRLEETGFHLHHAWSATLEVVGFMAILIHFIGPSALVGLAVLLIVLPLQGTVMKRLGQYREKLVAHTAQRVKVENEVIQGMRAIKFFSWVQPFLSLVGGVRESELNTIRRTSSLQAANAAALLATPALVAAACLVTYNALGGDMRASIVFTAIALTTHLRLPLMLIARTISSLADSRVSGARIDRFLAATEVQRIDQSPAASSGAAISVQNATMFWTDPDAKVVRVAEAVNLRKRGQDPEDAAGAPPAPAVPALRGLTFDVAPGELMAVVGPVGVGKSSLCAALLGELSCKAGGSVSVSGSVAYVAQQAWILNDSLRRNVLFGRPYDAERYQRAVTVCQLQPDIDLLQFGDATEIGERGITLSGGQQQRVSLARAVYADADIVILDDPLSALDAEVGNAVFEGAICGAMAGKTRLLCCNQLHLLPLVDRVMVLAPSDDGGARISEMGTYAALVESGLDFAALVAEFGAHGDASDSDGDGSAAAAGADAATAAAMGTANESDEEAATERALADVPPELALQRSSSASSAHSRERSRSRTRTRSRSRTISGARPRRASSSTAEASKPSTQLMESEERRVGAVSLHVWTSYFRQGGASFLAVVLLLYCASQSAMVVSSVWVAWWSDDTLNLGAEAYMAGFVAAAAAGGLLGFVRRYALVWLGVRASWGLHDALFRRLLHAPMSFYDTTPTGRIISRLARDTDQVDTSLPNGLAFGLLILFLVLGALVSVALEAPWFIACCVPLAAVYFHLLNLYRRVSRELKRCDSITRSPLYAHFSETLAGLSTIRAYAAVERFTRMNHAAVDKNDIAFFAMRGLDRWLGLRLETLGHTIALISAVLCTANVASGNISASAAGFAITQALGVTDLLAYSVRAFVDVENQLNAVERIVHYSEKAPQESSIVVPNYEAGAPLVPLPPPPPVASWPSKGEVTFRDVHMRYREGTPTVLKGVNASIRGGEKVGIVGRTGSGKSSLLLCAFRIVELLHGSITIDGRDIAHVPLAILRSRLGIIPQSPTLFSGTVRFNLDPAGEFDDAALWRAVEAVGLRDCLLAHAAAEGNGGDGLPEGAALARLALSAPVAEYGESFSQGERQLLCLARVMLRRAKVLLLDEATSSVDYATDQRMQQAIRDHFKDSTVLTVAHRLQTVAASTQIIVMRDGVVVENAPPLELLTDPDTAFSQLVKDLGPRAEAMMRQTAEAAAQEREAAEALSTGAVDISVAAAE